MIKFLIKNVLSHHYGIPDVLKSIFSINVVRLLSEQAHVVRSFIFFFLNMRKHRKFDIVKLSCFN